MISSSSRFALHVQRQRPHGHRDPRPSGRDDLSNIDALSRDEARRLSPQKSIRSTRSAGAAPTPRPPRRSARSPRDPLVDTRRSAAETGSRIHCGLGRGQTTRRCSVPLWPLGETVKLDDRGSSCAASATATVSTSSAEVRSVVQDWHPQLPDHPPPCGYRPAGVLPDGEGSGLSSGRPLHGLDLRSSDARSVDPRAARSAGVRHACCESSTTRWTATFLDVVRVTAGQAGVMSLAAGESVCYIGCHLLESSGGDWGYKSSMSPCIRTTISCPLRYLDMAPVQIRVARAVHQLHAGRAVGGASSITQPGRAWPAD